MSRRPLKAPEDYMRDGAGSPETAALLAIAAALLQIRDQISITNELLAADPAISHVVATRQIITEMRQQMEGMPEDEENDEDDEPDADPAAPTALN